jgi:protein-L-isoaspartate(D-aspartate) O-methyltransferase
MLAFHSFFTRLCKKEDHMSNQATLRTDAQPLFFETARFNMVESQLRPNGVLDPRILGAMGRLPREAFVAEDQKSFAYTDDAVSTGHGRKMLSPMVFAKLVQEANIQPADRVLDIGCASGYSCAVLNELAGEVIALENDPSLIRLIQQNKVTFELENVEVLQGNLSDGHPPVSPYQAIIVEGGAQWLPDALFAQLAEGGKLLSVWLPVKNLPGLMGRARLYTKENGSIQMRDLFDASAPLLSAFASRPSFEFSS